MARFLGSPAGDIAVVVGLVVLAALLRLPASATRGPWDTDQGEQMLAIRSIVQGQLTLLGAPTSTGGVHHGAVFYYLGALFALPSGGDDPTAVTFGIALGGIATVVFVWWMARAAGGRAGGGTRGRAPHRRLGADDRRVGPALEPGLRGARGGLRAGGGPRGARRGDPRWWVAERSASWSPPSRTSWRGWSPRRRGHGRGRAAPAGRGAVRWLAVAVVIVARAGLRPRAGERAHTGFGEVRAVLGARGGLGDGGSPVATGDLRAVPDPGGAPRGRGAAVDRGAGRRRLAVIGASLIAVRDRGRALGMPVAAATARVPGRRGAPLGVGLAIGSPSLVVGAPWLSQVIPLYVDHYHLALDPIVFALLGLAAAVLWRRRPDAPSWSRSWRRWPPGTSGWCRSHP